MSIPVMVGNAVDAISKNGVVMMNVALRGDGTIPENQAAYLTAFGDFLRINGEGIYNTRPWKTFGEGPLKVKDGRQGENHQDVHAGRHPLHPPSPRLRRASARSRHPLRLCAGPAHQGYHDQDPRHRRAVGAGDQTDLAVGQQGGDSLDPFSGGVDDPAAGIASRQACGRLPHCASMTTHHRIQGT